MEENTTVTTPEAVDNNGTATEQQQPESTQETREQKVIPFDEHQRAMTGQYKAGIAAAMKEAGFEPDKSDDFKAQMAAFRKWQDSQKTDAEKAADELRKAKEDVDAERAKTTALEQQIAALGKGIPADKAAKYIKLAEAYMDDATDFDAALDAALKDFPVAPSVGIFSHPASPEADVSLGDEFQQRINKYKRR